MVSTDHCPFCMKEQKELGIGDFSKIPNGIGSIEHRLDLLYQGVVMGEITLERWVELCSTTPARMFGLYGRKGVIEPGADADIVVYDPQGHTSIGYEKTHHMNMDHSAWEGFEIDGHVDVVMSRGSVVVDETGVPGRQGPRAVPPSAVSRSTSSRPPARSERPMDLGVVLQCNPPASRIVELCPPGGELRLLPRVDLRLAPAVGGAVRHLQRDPRGHPQDRRRADGHQPGHPRLDRHRVDLSRR